MAELLDPLVVELISNIATPYTSCYCEENIYLASQSLLQSALDSLENIFVVFISNSTKTVLLWEQKASQYPPETGRPVIWDYHVIMVLVAASPDSLESRADRVYVVDFDSSLGRLSHWKAYTKGTFHPDLFEDDSVDKKLQSSFRVISASRFVTQFASDRSHMLVEGSATEYKMPPPLYEPIAGSAARLNGVSNNLMTEYVCMTEEGAPGSMVLSMDEFMALSWLSTNARELTHA